MRSSDGGGGSAGSLGLEAAIIDGIIANLEGNIVGQAFEDGVEDEHGEGDTDAHDMLLPSETLRVQREERT